MPVKVAPDKGIQRDNKLVYCQREDGVDQVIVEAQKSHLPEIRRQKREVLADAAVTERRLELRERAEFRRGGYFGSETIPEIPDQHERKERASPFSRRPAEEERLPPQPLHVLYSVSKDEGEPVFGRALVWRRRAASPPRGSEERRRPAFKPGARRRRETP